MKIQIRNWKSREEIQITFLIVRHKKGNEHADWFKLSFDMFHGQNLMMRFSSRLDNQVVKQGFTVLKSDEDT